MESGYPLCARVTDAYRYRHAVLREHAQRAARLSWQRRVSTSATVQAFATSFMRLARPPSSSSKPAEIVDGEVVTERKV